MTKRLSSCIYGFLAAFMLLTSSCNSDIVFTDSHPIHGNIWKLMDFASFKVPIDDSLSANNISFIIRSCSSYTFRKMYLFITTTSPDGKSISDTLLYNITDEHGKYLGKGFGDVHELTVPYKSNVYFPRNGTYKFKIQHGMRVEDLKGIYDIGMKIEKIRIK